MIRETSIGTPQFPRYGGVLVHPTAVDFKPSPAATFMRPLENAGPQDVNALRAIEDLNRILSLQAGRDSTSRSVQVDMPEASADALRPMSKHSLEMMERVGSVATSASLGVLYHGLADVNSLPAESEGHIAVDTYRDAPMIIRAEADMTAQAADIARFVHHNIERGSIEDAEMLDEQTIARVSRMGQACFLLYGYTFRQDPSQPETAVRFPAFPACEAFLAATVLEQAQMADAVVRVVPRTFKKKEYAARWMLDKLGAKDLPVMSVAVGDNGGVNKIIHWNSTPNDLLDEVAYKLRHGSPSAN